MNPLAIIAILLIIARYLRESGAPGCERVGRKIEEDLAEVGHAVGQGCEYAWLGCVGLMLLVLLVGLLCRGCDWIAGRP